MLLEKIKLKKKQINKLSSKQSEREEFKKEYLEYIAQIIGKPFSECSTLDKYTALATMVRDSCTGLRTETVRRRQEAGRKVVFYFSLEFLIGRLLENYLIQIGIRDMVSDIMNELGTPLEEILECEKDFRYGPCRAEGRNCRNPLSGRCFPCHGHQQRCGN